MTYRRTVTAALATILVLSTALSVLLLRRIDRLRSRATLQEVLYIPSPAVLKRMSLGYTGLLADVYWTRAVQYFGGHHHAKSQEYKLLQPLLDITTTLDPHLIAAYQFGSVFLAQKPPEGAGLPEKAVELVQRGIRENPDEWRLYYELGFLEYMELKDPRAAAQAFDDGSKVPHAHPFLKILAAAMAQHAGEEQMARMLWTATYETSTDPMIRANAVKHLTALRVDDEVQRLEALVQQYRARNSHTPASFLEMISAGYLRRLPVDPAGHPYKLMPDGRVEVESTEELPFIRRGLPPGKEAPLLQITKDK